MGIPTRYGKALIPLALVLVATLVVAMALRTAHSAVEPNSVLKQVDESFVQVAQKVTPSVVNVSSTPKAVHISQRNDMESPFKDFPFRQFFGDEFFKHFNQAPKGHGGPTPMAMGSGVIVSSDGLILTNAHVVKNMENITVTLTDKRTFKAKVIGMDPDSDIAVIKIDAKNLPEATLGNSDKLRVGEVVFAIGNPFGLNGTVTSGIVSAKGRTNVGILGYEDFIQTDTAINPGNSGGPLVNIDGQVVGINTAIATGSGGYQGVGFAIPSNSAKLVMDQLVKEGKVHRGLLGVNIQDMNDALAKSFGRSDSNGALVAQVVPGSPAAKAGVRPGDIVLAFNGRPVTGASDLKNMVANEKPNSQAKLTIYRDHKTQEMTVAVGERTEKAVASATSKPQNSAELGVQLEKVPPKEAKHLGLKDGAGLKITSVDSEGVGSRMGLAPGDVILEIDGKAATDVASFNKEVKAAEANHVIRLMVQRGAETIFLAETIG